LRDASRPQKDAVLCYCGNGVMTADFERAVQVDSASSFEDVCRKLGVGQKCTACLLSAENLYCTASKFLVSAQSGAHFSTIGPAGSGPARLKTRLLGVLDKILPNLPKPRLEVSPVLVGSNLTTLLTVSNQFPPKIGARNAPVRVRLHTRNHQGKVLFRTQRVLRPGERLDIDIGESLEQSSLSDEISHGSCWIRITTIGRGNVGSIRPHFVLLTNCSACNLHTQSKNGKTQALIVMRDNPSERQFVSHINLSDEQARVTCRIRPIEAPENERRLERIVAQRGADLMELPLCLVGGRPVRGLYELLFESDRLVRRHWLAASSNLDRISADHV